MSNQYPGGVISKTPVVPNSISAPGIWTLSQQAAAQATNTWPFLRDPQFNYVTMLLHGDGSAQSLPTTGVGAGASAVVTPFNADASTNNFNVTINGDARSNNFTPYQGNGYYSALMSSGGGAGSYFSCSATTQFSFGTGDFCVETRVYITQTQNSNIWYPIFDTRPQNATNGAYPILGFQENTRYLFAGPSSSVTVSGAVGSLNTWMHVVWTRVSSVTRCFIDGVLVLYNGSDTTNYTVGGSGIRMGSEAFNSSPNSTFPGFFSNYRVSKGGIPTAYSTSSTTIGAYVFTPPTAPASTSDALSAGSYSLLTFQSNRFIDNSSNAFTVTPVSSPAVSPAQPFTLPSGLTTYGSGYFDGTTDYLTAPAATIVNFGTGDFTVDAWFYSTTTSGNRKILDNYNGNTNPNPALLLNIGGAGVVSWYSGQTAIINSSSNFVTNAWNYVTVSRVSGTTRMFLNGTQVGSASDSNNYAAGYTTVGIGGEPYSSGGASFLGYLTDVRVVKGSGVTSSTVPTSPLTAITNTVLLTTQYNGGGNNSGFKDSSQNNFPITRNGNTTQGTFTPYEANWSNYFNGSTDYLTIPDNDAFWIQGDFTFEAWVYQTSAKLVTIIGQLPISGTSSFVFRVQADGKVSFFYELVGGSGSNGTPSTSTVAINTWNHIVWTRSGTTFKYFINGVQDATTQTISGAFKNGTGSVTIGLYNTGADTYMNGYISNARFVNGTALYSSNFTPSITPLTAITNTSLLTCQSNRFIDNSSNAFTITSNGSPSVQSFSPFAPLVVYNPAVNSGSGYFDGSGDYLTPATSPAFAYGTGDLTFECWIYATTASDSPIYESRSTNSNTDGFTVTAFSSTVIRVYTTAVLVTGTVPNYVNSWTHVAYTRQGSTNRLFVNGALVGTATAADNFSNTTAVIGAGRYASSSLSAYFTGYMADVRILKGTALYTSAFTPNTAPLTAVTGTSLLLSNTNAAIFDNAMMNVLETVPSAQISTTVTKFGAASMKFDGDTDYVGMPKNENVNLGSGNFTIEFWAYWNAFGSDKKYVLSVTNGSNYWQFNHDSSVGVGFLVNGSTIASQGSNSGWSTATWYHVALVRNGSTITIYRNGTSVASGSIGTGALSNYNNFCIGGSAGFPSTTMDGYIDEFRLTRGVARYTTTFTPPTAAFPNG